MTGAGANGGLPNDSAPNESSPNSTAPKDTGPNGAAPNDTAPNGAASKGAGPKGAVPNETDPNRADPNGGVLKGAGPNDMAPNEVGPRGGVSGGAGASGGAAGDGVSGVAEVSAPAGPEAGVGGPGAYQRWLDLGLKVFGALLMLALGGVTAIYEVMYSPSRIDGVRFPISLVLAVVVNPVLATATYWVVGRRLAALLPALPWCVVWLIASAKTREGDLFVNNQNWVGLITLLAGPIAFALAVFIPVLREQRKIINASSPVPPGPRTARSGVTGGTGSGVAARAEGGAGGGNRPKVSGPAPGAKPAEAGKKRKASAGTLRAGGKKR